MCKHCLFFALLPGESKQFRDCSEQSSLRFTKPDVLNDKTWSSSLRTELCPSPFKSVKNSWTRSQAKAPRDGRQRKTIFQYERHTPLSSSLSDESQQLNPVLGQLLFPLQPISSHCHHGNRCGPNLSIPDPPSSHGIPHLVIDSLSGQRLKTVDLRYDMKAQNYLSDSILWNTILKREELFSRLMS